MESNQTPRIATVKELRPLLATLQSMHDWAVNSIAYVKRRNHLSFEQKQTVAKRIGQYVEYLANRINLLKEGVFETQIAALDYDIQKALVGQTKYNWYGWYYEFPRYPLPEPFDWSYDFEFLLKEVTADSLETILYRGDQLWLKPVYSLSILKPVDLVVVTYRHDYKHPREEKIGWFKAITDNTLVLAYDRPRLTNKRPDWTVSMHDVIHIHRVKITSRDR